ncbi:Dual specificity phosphatase, catalytic domain [Neorhodopirellula lusitana]|uniref:Dual specificity phosphatase, catalytic domain n=1 Tax=Neorhodopirellula lusitana TaxID=445327 RepID=A0ABY1Q823_9BACT|nr:dual specificity protein phosphatase family protein [Neorhodopirellula lusitana]SMP60247.1 Dual specificity phosphatase, catalytic domain [Neorhodopirellula lusitana]
MKYGFIFLLLALAISVAAARGGPWGWLLIYPAFSFGVVSAAYLFSAPGVFGKRFDGGRSRLGTLLLLPYVLYLAAVWHVVRLLSREPKLNLLGDDLVLSRRLLGHELPENISSVVDLTCEFTEPNDHWKIQSYTCYPMLDGTAATAGALRELAVKINDMPKPVLIHCAQGHGRTGLVAAAVLLVSERAQTASDAIAMVQSARPGVELNGEQWSVLEELQ